MIDPRGRRVLVALASYRSKRYVYERARELGVRLVAMDGKGHWAQDESGSGKLFDEFIPVDLTPRPALIEDAATALGSREPFDAIMTIEEFGTPFCAGLAARLGLWGHSIEAVATVRNKALTRRACVAAGLPSPRFAVIRELGDVSRAAEAVRFPSVLKPTSGVGTVQAYRVLSQADLETRVKDLIRETSGTTVTSASRSDKSWFDLMWSGPFELVLEEFIDGPKADIDIVVSNGDLVYAGVIDDETPQNLRDVARTAPSTLPPHAQEAMVEHAWKSIVATGLLTGVFNVEVKWTDDGPRLIEINGRLGGYGTWDVHRSVWGVDLIEFALATAHGPLDLPKHALMNRPALTCVAESLLPAQKTGVLRADGFLDCVRDRPGIQTARPWMFEGDAVVGADTDVPDWLGNVIARGETHEAARATLAEALRLVRPAIY